MKYTLRLLAVAIGFPILFLMWTFAYGVCTFADFALEELND